jgi:hypothetical protein
MNEHSLVGEALKQGAVPEGYKEVEVQFFHFKAANDCITGRLIEKDKQRAGNSIVGKYTVITENNNRVSFMGSTQLDEKMRQVPVGNDIIVAYTHAEQSSDNTKNPMKIYKVFSRDVRQKTEL